MYMVNRGARHTTTLRNQNRRTQRLNDIQPVHANNNNNHSEENDASDHSNKNGNNGNSIIEMSSPKPVFNNKKSYGRTNSGPGHATVAPPGSPDMQQSDDAAARFLHDAWVRTKAEVDYWSQHGRGRKFLMYQDTTHCLQGFEPFDLEQWKIRRNGPKSYQQ